MPRPVLGLTAEEAALVREAGGTFVRDVLHGLGGAAVAKAAGGVYVPPGSAGDGDGSVRESRDAVANHAWDAAVAKAVGGVYVPPGSAGDGDGSESDGESVMLEGPVNEVPIVPGLAVDPEMMAGSSSWSGPGPG